MKTMQADYHKFNVMYYQNFSINRILSGEQNVADT